MSALTEIGLAFERFGQKLQSKEPLKEPITPYEHAKALWNNISPGRKIDPVESVFLDFRFTEIGVNPEGMEQNIFTRLLSPYRGLFPELDIFTVSLSINEKTDDVSFKLSVFASPPSPQFNFSKSYPVLTIRELPEQKRGCYSFPTPYNLLILGESQLYTGRLNQELTGIDYGKGLLYEGFGDWQEGCRGDIDWRRQFTNESLKFLTRIANTGSNDLLIYNQGIQEYFRKQEKSVSWWNRTWRNRLHPGAVLPESLTLSYIREGLIGYPPSKLTTYFQQA